MQCVILAGGLGTRMRPVTETIPKILIPVHGRPFADYQLAWLASEGVTDVVLCVAHKGDQVRDYVGDGRRWNLRVEYSDEGQELKGTAGALRVACDAGLLEETFLVLYGDSFLSVDFREALRTFHASGAKGMMTVFHNRGRWEVNNVIFRGGHLELYDKSAQRPEMEFVDYGLSILRRPVIEERVPAGLRADLADLLHGMSVRGELAGMEVSQRFYEVGSAAGLADFENFAETILVSR